VTARRLPNGSSVRSINHSETDYLYREIFVDRMYIPVRPLPTAPVVIDVGANIGLFSLFAVREWPGARVYAFEPVPAVFEVLHENTADVPGVVVKNLALGREPGEGTMLFYPGYTMMSGFDADPDADRELVLSYVRNVVAGLTPERGALLLETTAEMLQTRLAPEPVNCRVERLSDVARRAGIERIDLLKVDVEGHELPVLQGIDTQTWPLIQQVVVEVADRVGRLAAVTELLRKNGLQSVTRQPTDYRGTDLFMVYASRPQ
jgi:FkbM family methyltransferase